MNNSDITYYCNLEKGVVVAKVSYEVFLKDLESDFIKLGCEDLFWDLLNNTSCKNSDWYDDIVSRASCSPLDKFDLTYGKNLANRRVYANMYKKKCRFINEVYDYYYKKLTKLNNLSLKYSYNSNREFKI